MLARKSTVSKASSSRHVTCVAQLVATSNWHPVTAMPCCSSSSTAHSSAQRFGLTSVFTTKVKGFGQGCKQPIRLAPAQSFLGVGAPEALLVGVVALVVFGPKGLAEAAKSLGNTLRAFQPTIREVVEVSQDIKGTLEKELGLDELRDAARVTPRPKTELPETGRSMDELLRSGTSVGGFSADVDPDIEAKRAAAAAAAWGEQKPAAAAAQTTDSPAASGEHTASKVPSILTMPETAEPASTPAAAPSKPAAQLGTLSMEELEAELARRKAAAAASSGKGQ